MPDPTPTLSWIRTGATCGLLGVAAYAAAAFAPIPERLALTLAFAFGPLVSLACVGLHALLAIPRRRVALDTAALLGVAAGITVLAMLTVQQALVMILRDLVAQATDPAGADALRALRRPLDSVHFGLDVAWDVLIATATILFGWSMLAHPRFGRVMSATGIALGALLLGYNLWYFPVPPAASRSIDWGPFVALWMLVAYARAAGSVGWARERLGAR